MEQCSQLARAKYESLIADGDEETIKARLEEFDCCGYAQELSAECHVSADAAMDAVRDAGFFTRKMKLVQQKSLPFPGLHWSPSLKNFSFLSDYDVERLAQECKIPKQDARQMAEDHRNALKEPLSQLQDELIARFSSPDQTRLIVPTWEETEDIAAHYPVTHSDVHFIVDEINRICEKWDDDDENPQKRRKAPRKRQVRLPYLTTF